ncbi:MAG: hypothetical protein NXI32_09295 [bacterium]|nr:hypothetical protein [bacterium]
MLLRYGTYRHRVAEANVQIRRTPLENASGGTFGYRERWTVTGKLFNPTGNARNMGPVIQAFENAYSQSGRDAALEFEDGTPSHHQLLNANSLGGVRVVQPPEFPDGKKGELVNYRSYSLAIEAMFPIFRGQSLFIEFSERISIRGGGRRWGVVEVNRGPGVRQMIRTHTKCTATQSGSATLFVGWPDPPKPIWPFALVDEFPDFDVDSPETIAADVANASLINGGVSWTYNYEFPLRLFGTPHYLRF